MNMHHKTFSIRLAVDADIAALTALEKACFTTDRLPPSQIKKYIHAENALVEVVSNVSEIIGTAILLFRKRSRIARLYSIAVHPAWQKKRIASALLSSIEKAAEKRGCTCIRLEVREDNHHAIEFYLRHGYKKTGSYPAFYEDGEDAVKMVKKLIKEFIKFS